MNKQDYTEQITQKYLKSILEYDPDTGVFIWKIRKKGIKRKVAGYINNNGYRVITINRTTQLAHRLAWLYMTGEWPKGQIDHINHDKDHNRIENLNDVSVRGNAHNRLDNKTFVGVYWHPDNNKWISKINIRGKIEYLGSFETHLAACYARHQANLEIGYA